MEAAIFIVNLLLVIVGIRIVFQVPPLGAFWTALAVATGMTFLRALGLQTGVGETALYFVSSICATVPVFWLLNRINPSPWWMFVAPPGALFILSGGPIQIGLLLYEVGEITRQMS